MKRAWLSLAALVAIVSTTGPAKAKASADLRYSREQVFSSALRYLRVDLGIEVVERDADAAYLLFNLQDAKDPGPRTGSFEIVETSDGVTVHVQLAKSPGYRESMLRDGLVRKVSSDYGPPSRKPEAPAPPKKDQSESDEKGAEGGKD